MGCDIHLWAERRDKGKYDDNEYQGHKGHWDDEPWQVVRPAPKKCWSCGGYGDKSFCWADADSPELAELLAAGAIETGETRILGIKNRVKRIQLLKPLQNKDWCFWCSGTGRVVEAFYDTRNYELFAMLADVRNYGNLIEPFDEPRGVPRDGSDEYIASTVRWGVDGHSHSWFTIHELLEIDWDGKIEREEMCCVGDRAWLNLLATGSPWKYPEDLPEEDQSGVSVAGGIYKKGKELISFEEAEKDPMKWEGHPVRIHWQETYAEAAGEFHKVLTDELAHLGDPHETRICFFFDN